MDPDLGSNRGFGSGKQLWIKIREVIMDPYKEIYYVPGKLLWVRIREVILDPDPYPPT